jgi:hypothetical protein
MILTGLVILTLVSAALPAWAVFTRRLNLSKDYFFLIVYAEIFVYLHLAPTLWANDIRTELQGLYFQLQLAAIVLFEIPILWLYQRSSKRDRVIGSRKTAPMAVSGPRLLRLALLAAVLCAAFAYVAFTNGIFFMRIGWQEAIEALLGLTFPEFVTYRLFALSGAFLIGVLVVSIMFQRRERAEVEYKRLVLILTAFIMIIFFTYQAFNSKLHTAVAASVVLGALIVVGRIPVASRKGLLVGGLSLMVVWYGFRVATNARNILSQGTMESRIFNPFLSWERDEEDDFSDWRFRLNGLDLMARITPAAEQQGFAKGEAWRGFVLVTIGQLTLGSVISSEEVAANKAAFLGSPKKYLMDQYLDGDWIDYPSCILTDLYGNFGLLGFPIGAVVVSWACNLARRAFTEAGSPLSVVIALYVVFHLLLFEQELAVFFSSLLNTLPVLLLVILLNPMVAERRVPRT